jgi:hypothetical protein
MYALLVFCAVVYWLASYSGAAMGLSRMKKLFILIPKRRGFKSTQAHHVFGLPFEAMENIGRSE